MSVTLDVELREERRRILAAVDGHLDEVVETAVDAIRADIPVYGDAPRGAHRGRARARRARTTATKVACLGAEQTVTLEDLAFSRGAATRRARAGVGLEDYINAYRVGAPGVLGRACWTAPAAAPAGARRRSRSRRR